MDRFTRSLYDERREWTLLLQRLDRLISILEDDIPED